MYSIKKFLSIIICLLFVQPCAFSNGRDSLNKLCDDIISMCDTNQKTCNSAKTVIDTTVLPLLNTTGKQLDSSYKLCSDTAQKVTDIYDQLSIAPLVTLKEKVPPFEEETNKMKSELSKKLWLGPPYGARMVVLGALSPLNFYFEVHTDFEDIKELLDTSEDLLEFLTSQFPPIPPIIGSMSVNLGNMSNDLGAMRDNAKSIKAHIKKINGLLKQYQNAQKKVDALTESLSQFNASKDAAATAGQAGVVAQNSADHVRETNDVVNKANPIRLTQQPAGLPTKPAAAKVG